MLMATATSLVIGHRVKTNQGRVAMLVATANLLVTVTSWRWLGAARGLPGRSRNWGGVVVLELADVLKAKPGRREL